MKVLMRSIFLAVVIFTLTVDESNEFSLDDATELIEVGVVIAKKLYQLWDTVNQEVMDSNGTVHFPFPKKRENKILTNIKEISRRLDDISTKVDTSSTATINAILNNFPSRIRLELRLNELAYAVASINSSNRILKDYVDAARIERHTLEDFATWAVSHDHDGIRAKLEMIHGLMSSGKDGLLDRGILELIRENMEEANSDLCNLHQSPQQLLYNLYNSVALTELKGYSMMQFSWMLLKMYNKGNFTQEAELMKQRFIERTRTTIAAVKKVMSSASKHLWNCDPKRHIKGDTYLEITQLLQGFVINEVDMNSDSTCRENCGYYTYAKSYGCYKNQYCSRQRKCGGKIINCFYVDSDMWICPSETSSDRRYEYIEYENGRVLGRKMNCPRGTTKVDSWWRWLFWHCSYCMCLCDEQGQYSDRYFNMRAVESDVANNKVITGLRFVKVNRIIHLQIQQGLLMERGNIKADSLEWVSPESYHMSDPGVENGRDYHTLTLEQRAIDLDDLVVEEGHVVTGVRFRKVGSHLNFEIRATPFNFTSGTLINPLQKSVWISNDNTDGAISNPRKELRLQSPDVPTRSPGPSAPDSETDQYIQFINTDLDRDAAQTTVPFIDSQRVEPQIPMPLSGAGIYHKGQPTFGGFIAPRLITYDFTPHLQIPDPDKFEPEEIESN